MFRSLHISSSVVHSKSTVNIQITKSLLQCYSTFKIKFENFYFTIFMVLNTNIMDKTIKTFTLTIKNTVNI